jgi:hypothetical protein
MQKRPFQACLMKYTYYTINQQHRFTAILGLYFAHCNIALSNSGNFSFSRVSSDLL